MPLSVTCPRCESKYKLDEAMRGKRMRCPNPICRAVFEVRDDNDPPAAAPPVEKPKPQEAPPPVVTKPVKPKPIPKPIEPQPAADFPDDFPGDDEAAPTPSSPAIATEAWQPEAEEAPPVREEPAPIRETIIVSKSTPAPVKRQRALWVITAMILLLGIVAGTAYWRLRGGLATNEAERFQKAEELYKEQQFADASAALQKLQRDFPDSPHNKKYGFLAELGELRQAVRMRESSAETSKALGRVREFVTVYNGDPLLKEREADIWETLDFLAGELTRLAKAEESPDLMSAARAAWTDAKKYSPPAGTSMAERERKLTADWKGIDATLTTNFERQQLVTALRKHIEQANAAAVQEAQALVEKSNRKDEAEVRKLLSDLITAHREQIRFVPAETKPDLPGEDPFLSLSVTPSLKAAVVNRERPEPTKDVVLALARGVLYALDPNNGDVRWVRRVGIDTHILPTRVPADAITPELLLTLSSDQRSLSALIAETGKVFWQTASSDACLGQPVLVDKQLLVPTLAGRIDEIEIAEGRLLGSYNVGQPLTLGGLRQPGTPLVYFPADDFCLYVIDTTKRACTNILYTRHPPGSLRGLPAIVANDKGSYLLWTQATGLASAEIRPYELPLTQSEQKPIEPIVPIKGMSAPPWLQADRLAVATQAGNLSLWGIRQKGTSDPLLFRMQQDFALDPGDNVPCQVVHADAENYWTLTRGQFQRVQSTFDPKNGPKLVKRGTPIPLGTLLHAVQTNRDADGRTILYVTTQADDHPTCLCSAIDAEDGKLVWQRQLGVLPRQAPRDVGGQVILEDAHGLVRFDPNRPAEKITEAWLKDGAWILQEPWSDGYHILLTRENTYVQLTGQRGGKKMHVRLGSIGDDNKTESFDVALTGALQGTPALGPGFLLLPLAEGNGVVTRVNLEDRSPIKGADWRAAGAEEQARGHVVLLNATQYLVTDGSTGIARVDFADAKNFKKLGAAQLAHRIVAPPVLVSVGDKQRVCVVDASDTVTLFDPERLREVQPQKLEDLAIRRLTMPGKVTAGPFVRDGKIGCIVAKNRLVWLDPEKGDFAWGYHFGDIVGEPNVIDGALVVADVAGRFVALNLKNGEPGPILTLKANVAATAAPLRYGPGRAFVPLSDGTIMILPLEKLRMAN